MIRTLVFVTAALAMAGVAVADPPTAPSTSQPTATTSTAAPAAKAKHHARHKKVDCSKDANKDKKACKTPS